MNNLVKCSNNGLFCNDALQALGTAIPVYKISVETGKIMVSKSEAVDKVDFIWLGMTRYRVLLPEYEQGIKAQAICHSSDCIRPDRGTSKMDVACSECKLSKFEKNKAPECLEIFVLFGWDVQAKRTFKLQVKRSGIKMLRAMTESVETASCSSTLSGRYPSNLLCGITLQSQREKNYFVPFFQVITVLKEEEKARFFFSLAQSVMARALGGSQNEEEEEEEEVSSVAGVKEEAKEEAPF